MLTCILLLSSGLITSNSLLIQQEKIRSPVLSFLHGFGFPEIKIPNVIT